ncbi:hypothetical protein V6N13_122366 [Hibiscus sabdariffa]
MLNSGCLLQLASERAGHLLQLASDGEQHRNACLILCVARPENAEIQTLFLHENSFLILCLEMQNFHICCALTCVCCSPTAGGDQSCRYVARRLQETTSQIYFPS